MRGNTYQAVLIGLGLIVTAMIGVFLYREIAPEYKIYQNDYIALEKFRSEYTGEPPPLFQTGVKQIVMPQPNNAPAEVDRCISCHVALQFEHFSPTVLKKDLNGDIVKDSLGIPLQEPNQKYIWAILDKKIAELQASGNAKDTKRAEELLSLKTARVGEYEYDVTKVLRMHPLIGKETRPFEFHPIEEYGCVSCHGGNGRGLTTNKAHGPVFDGQYEAEFTGPEPVFVESDPENDPAFSRIFNHKPGHELLFQTTPILIGSLMEAKCVQCHQRTEDSLSDTTIKTNDLHMDVDTLTQHYQAGKELYISQACYACHRIAGFSRGGIGPEHTLAGKNYPWFLKESIVWPQADLHTSTMPNYKMDHQEVEDLMTFMLSLNGKTKAESEISHKLTISNWEAGKKMPWEKPVTPAQVNDLRFGMTVFATEGCSSCHRLKGFESNVGFKVEKSADEQAVYREHEWFRSLFPEEISGSELVTKLDEHSNEIDNKIIDDARTNSILEEIYKVNPQAIDALYTNFRYASRAKNHHFKQLSEQAKDEETKNDILTRKQEWLDRVHRVKMIYIQEYGLGRLIGPRPNWSGVYRSDEWLMEHFWNPQSHAARSIMPVFPFDNTKFYSLVHMLDVLGKKNRDAVRHIWDRQGFSPSEAYEIFCSQCHGTSRQGNGPVSEWIYPIPKNLRNSDFLRNLTKANAVESIVHGVKGGPMPPWGETPSDKPNFDGIPVMTKDEINELVNWLYSSLPGGKVIQSEEDVPKWQYNSDDIIKELKDEGDFKKFMENRKINNTSSLLDTLPDGSQYLVSLSPTAPVNPNTESSQIFDITKDPLGNEGEELFYIKPQFYTRENLEQGKAYFEEYCATCHGKEGDGAGNRAGTMKEAKPRMLTNLHWLDTRDDLRLLRSIKYGVLGTAMTPWGDQTNALQRMQLVMYIRTLSKQSKLRDELLTTLYQSFRESEIAVEKARIASYPLIDELQKEFTEAQTEKEELNSKVLLGKASPPDAVKAYEKELNALARLNKAKSKDQLLLDLKDLLNKERIIYENLGMSIVNKGIDHEIFKTYDRAVSYNAGRFRVQKDDLIMSVDVDKIKSLTNAQQTVINEVDAKVKDLGVEEELTRGKIASSARAASLREIKGSIAGLESLKKSLIEGFKETSILRDKQTEIYKKYQKEK